MHFAALKGHEAVVQMLLKAGADVNAVDKKNGSTPLQLAASKGKMAVVQMLLKAGADVKAVNNVSACVRGGWGGERVWGVGGSGFGV